MKNKFNIHQVRKHWDKVAKIYDDCNKKPTNPHFQRFVVGVGYMDLKPKTKVLNIWSRTGDSISYLRGKCKEVKLYNHEASKNMIKKAQEKCPGEKFMLTDLENLDYPENFFDYILCLETLEHTPYPSKLLQEFHRTLKPNGKLIMSLPPATAELSYQLYMIFFGSHGEGPHKFLSSKTVKRLLKEENFRLLEHRSTLLIPVFGERITNWGEKIISKFQNTFIGELGVRQFYVCSK